MEAPPTHIPTMRTLEFYSGIGGFHYAAKSCSKIKADIVQSFDVNTVVNRIYERNFAHNVNPKSLDGVSAKQLDNFEAQLWTMSPPCQPFSRNGNQLDDTDKRNSSFLHLIDILPSLTVPPNFLIIENVSGFHTSRTREKLLACLATLNFTVQEFLINSLDYGIPNSRLRYFLVAKRSPLKFAKQIDCISTEIPLTPKPSLQPLKNFLESDSELLKQFRVPEETCQSKSAMLFDVVNENSTSCCCFTKNYSRCIEGAGSVIQTDMSLKGAADALSRNAVRYFTPREISRLHYFPAEFSFPKEVSLKQQYAALGNSLNVRVVQLLLDYLFTNG